MVVSIQSSTLLGITSRKIDVEVCIHQGFPKLTIVGLPKGAVKESKERIKSAIRNSGFEYPKATITINLAPADLAKEDAAFDLPIALGILAASEQIPNNDFSKWLIVGELSLNGMLKSVRGGLNIAIFAKEQTINNLLVPLENTNECNLIEQINVHGCTSLIDAANRLISPSPSLYLSKDSLSHSIKTPPFQENHFYNLNGQPILQRGLTIAAAGGHHVLLTGPPGTGKSLAAKYVASLLPPLEQSELIEVAKIQSILGKAHDFIIDRHRPYRAPHHTLSECALIGGGTGIPRPGEITLAHKGVLFLDELPEFKRHVLETLRQPMQEREVVIARSKEVLTFPSDFLLISAMNPCPCGNYFGNLKHKCTCSPSAIYNYQMKISSAFLDRIDLHIPVPRLDLKYMNHQSDACNPCILNEKEHVISARGLQFKRYNSATTNSKMSPKDIQSQSNISQVAIEHLVTIGNHREFSIRSFHKTIKVARTIADIDDVDTISIKHINEALFYSSPNV